MEKDEEVPPGGLLIFWGGAGKAGSPTYQGAPVGPLEIPLDGAVVQADPLVLPVLVWGHGGGLGGHSRPPAPPNRAQGLEAVFGGGLGRGWEVGRGRRERAAEPWCPLRSLVALVSPAVSLGSLCPCCPLSLCPSVLPSLCPSCPSVPAVPCPHNPAEREAPFWLSFPTLNPLGEGPGVPPPWLPGSVGSGPSPRTVDEVLLLGGQDGGQVPPVVPALRLRVLPAPPGGEVLVAGSLEAVPAGAAPPQR